MHLRDAELLVVKARSGDERITALQIWTDALVESGALHPKVSIVALYNGDPNHPIYRSTADDEGTRVSFYMPSGSGVWAPTPDPDPECARISISAVAYRVRTDHRITFMWIERGAATSILDPLDPGVTVTNVLGSEDAYLDIAAQRSVWTSAELTAAIQEAYADADATAITAFIRDAVCKKLRLTVTIDGELRLSALEESRRDLDPNVLRRLKRALAEYDEGAAGEHIIPTCANTLEQRIRALVERLETLETLETGSA